MVLRGLLMRGDAKGSDGAASEGAGGGIRGGFKFLKR
jgi:hypothetical protein